MEQGMKLWAPGLFREHGRMKIHTANPDDNIEQVLAEIGRGEGIDHAVYVIEVRGIPDITQRGDEHYEGIRFHFESGNSIDVQLGPRVEGLVLRECADRLYYLDKNPAKTSDGPYRFARNLTLEEQFGAFQEEVWKAGL